MALTLQGVTKVSGAETHIHPTDLTLERGGMTVLLGPTLAGKTSLMRLMAGLDRPDAGRILFDGRDVTRLRVQDRNVAMVYQQFINYPAATVYDNIASPLRIKGLASGEIDRRVRQAAGLVRLDEVQLRKRPLELSGGQQQRCALARALVKEATLVLLDEPLANLDYKLREELRAELPRIFADSGAIFVYATTEPHEALLLGGNTACLHEGRVTQIGPTPEVYRAPVDATTARVFSDPPMNFAPVRKSGQSLDFGTGAFPAGPLSSAPDGRYMAGFRPNHLHITRPETDAMAFNAHVAVTEITGSESFVHVDWRPPGGEPARWVALAHGVHEPPLGTEMRVFVEPRHLYLFAESGALAAAAPYATAA
ncbi:ABC transporter ATP-binding protein [Rubrimonas cliftonensis]|uniref:Carbohydrate ABC transporter ATP-binding protein, CUT1 family n=1 Tax=Rubrimonas cliftonensis TaxID=89524 RepID=A0A1H3YMM1_9RHOB|nr:ABC transporter ATP-binding protein [Rubrimonas cliftonensis]SEA12743.1 carbohydrate ABC transporter ATP-binding protein, CUT1 family [Rubrimonas cliftonensis]